MEEAPRCLHGILVPIFYLGRVGGYCCCEIYVEIVKRGIFPNFKMQNDSDGMITNKSNLQTYYFVTSAIILVYLLLYIYVAKQFKEKRERERLEALERLAEEPEESSSSINWDALSWNEYDPTLRISTAY